MPHALDQKGINTIFAQILNRLPAISEIRLMIQDAELEPALAAFRAWLHENHPHEVIFCDQISGNLKSAKEPYLQGRINYETFSRELANIRYALLEKIAEYMRTEAPHFAQRKAVSLHHAITCDRVEQVDAFDKLQPTLKSGNIHFFYLYGGELQAHKSLFRRLAYEFEGRYSETPSGTNIRKAIQLTFLIKESQDPQVYCEKFIRDLFDHFGVDPNDHYPLMARNLQYLIDKSPKLKELKASDAVFVLAHVSHWTWHKDLTPAAARWFIKEFCQCALPVDAPLFLFFFSFDYDDTYYPEVKSEVMTAVNQSDYVQAFPELNMVQRRDVGAWLAIHPQFIPTAHIRNQILQQHFNASEYYMEDVERILSKIIDDNKNQLIT